MIPPFPSSPHPFQNNNTNTAQIVFPHTCSPTKNEYFDINISVILIVQIIICVAILKLFKQIKKYE